MSKLEIELRPDEEQRLTQAAGKQGLSVLDYARQRLLDAAPNPPRTAADMLAHWRERGLTGAWADRADIGDSGAYARRLRERTQTRLAPADEVEDAA